MVRNYVPRLDRVPGNKIREAIKYYKATGQNQRETCDVFGLTRSVFQKYLKMDPDSIPDELSQGAKPIFTPEMEEEILRHVRHMAKIFYAMTRKSLAELGYQLAVENGLKHQFQNGVAGNGWVDGFLSRHPQLSLQTGTPTSLARITSFNRPSVYRFFDLLTEVVAEKHFTARTIFNMDESGLTVVPGKRIKRIGLRGMRSLPVMVPVERGQLCTVVCGFSASGDYIPPMFVISTSAEHVSMELAPTNSIVARAPKGWSNSECFRKWLKHFRRYATPDRTEPVLLILDNHGSHINYKAVQYCRRHHISLLTLPPYCTHKMQPCDVAFFSPLKAKYSEYILRWLVEHPHRKPRTADIPAIFGYAYPEAAKRETAINGFRKTGIWHCNPQTQEWGPNKYAFDEEFDEQDTDDDSSDESEHAADDPPDHPDDVIPRQVENQQSSSESEEPLQSREQSPVPISTRSVDSPGYRDASSQSTNSQSVSADPIPSPSTHSQSVTTDPIPSQSINSQLVTADPIPSTSTTSVSQVQQPVSGTQNVTPKKRKLRKRSSLVAYARSDSSSPDSDTDCEYDIVAVDNETRVRDDILTGVEETINEEEEIEAVLLTNKKGLNSITKKTLTVKPSEIQQRILFPSTSSEPSSTRKPRERKKSQLLTSDENFKRLAALERTKKPTSSDSEERRQTRSLTTAAKKGLRSGKRL